MPTVARCVGCHTTLKLRLLHDPIKCALAQTATGCKVLKCHQLRKHTLATPNYGYEKRQKELAKKKKKEEKLKNKAERKVGEGAEEGAEEGTEDSSEEVGSGEEQAEPTPPATDTPSA